MVCRSLLLISFSFSLFLSLSLFPLFFSFLSSLFSLFGSLFVKIFRSDYLQFICNANGDATLQLLSTLVRTVVFR